MPIHDWSRVSAGTFHHFHNSWITHLGETLNGGLLPEEYYALSEQHAGQVNPDLLTLTTLRRSEPEAPPRGALALAEAPPRVSLQMSADEDETYRMARRTLAIRHRSGHRIIALIEIVSPGNKDGEQHLRQFIDKCISALRRGIHLLVVDLHPPSKWDPDGIHGEIWDEVGGCPFQLPKDKPLVLAAYLGDTMPKAFVEPIALGSELPQMPVFLHLDWYINVPLEPTYMMSYRGAPAFWREVIEGHRPAEEDGR